MSLSIAPHNNDLVGFGVNIRKIKDSCTDRTIAYVSDMDGREVVYFPQMISKDDLFRVAKILQNQLQSTP